MENIRNYKTNCKVNLMKFYHLQHKDKSSDYEQKTQAERNKKLFVKF